ncbi:winged helix-turn-helix domain-containing protein [Sporomusa sphaeroides]|uniref:Restriction system protein Mrr-like N-terminal domain-containing protein n=1 Tax=Sporomusa sphaeroides DSM 2875 TaxID=1337886 RepID=A0ABM9W5K0_9FIRM|nr:winged helix-turn-helix domain-containing protein [Sporomusa sphaeroides]OLS54740.1 Mrr restriction system protein [Sporomusa sphaeroides DSM 2875]CVK20111.1 hypothetical protein SSPH_02778 [Sporomusa sphaeroides DSM 2875]
MIIQHIKILCCCFYSVGRWGGNSFKELHQVLADDMQLDEEERTRQLLSGPQSIFYNRVGWVRTYLKKALLIEAIAAGKFRITERGRALLLQKPSRIDKCVLS